jgi:hypothetical protein
MQAQEAPNGIASAEPVEIGAAEVTPRTLGDTREDLVFTPLFRACRMADTRRHRSEPHSNASTSSSTRYWALANAPRQL